MFSLIIIIHHVFRQTFCCCFVLFPLGTLHNVLVFHCLLCSESQPAVFGFHDNHGTRIVLSDNQQTAERTGPKGRGAATNGIVMSRDPIKLNKLYEVNSNRENYTQ